MAFDWNHFRYVLELGRSGTVRGAAERLDMHHATLSRHLMQLQDALGVRLLERDGRRFAFTEAGQEMLEAAEAIEARVTQAHRALSGRDTRPHGRVRVALPESVLVVLAPKLHTFSTAFPSITLDLLSGLSFKNLARREADVAVRIADAPPPTLVGRRVAPVRMHACADRDLLDRLEPCELADYPWIGWSERHRHFPMEQWLRTVIDANDVHFTVDSTADLVRLVQSGAGVGVLPSFVIRSLPAVRRARHKALPVFENQVWVLTHADLRRVPRVRAVVDWLSEACRHVLETNET